MSTNVGTTDRIVRIVLAIIAAVVAFLVGPSTVLGIVLFVVAAILLVTALVRFCPLYRLVRVNTNR